MAEYTKLHLYLGSIFFLQGVSVMVFYTNFINFSVMSWRSALLVEESGIWHNVVSSTPRLSEIRTHNVSSDNMHTLHRQLLMQLPYDHDHDGPIFIHHTKQFTENFYNFCLSHFILFIDLSRKLIMQLKQTTLKFNL